MSNPAPVKHPVSDLVARRQSPYAIDGRPIPPEDLRSLFEAARWAASSYNEQPWRYIVATMDDPETFDRILQCLVEPNRAWAKEGYALALGAVRKQFERNGKPNAHAHHDLGAASATLALEAVNRGLVVHQMAGIFPDKARETFSLPDEFEVVTGLCIGHGADPKDAPEALLEKDQAKRSRRPLETIVFGGEWGKPAAMLSD